MASLFLLIPDPALCDAVAEQIKAALAQEAQIIAQPQNWLKQYEATNHDIVIIDNPANDKKIAALLDGLGSETEKPVILTLGGAEDAEHVTENFAKPFRLGHLISRLRYYVETAPLLRTTIVIFGPYRLEPQNRRIIREDQTDPIRLTEKETALLVFLGRNEKPATRQDILAAVWGYDERIDTHTLETHIYQLRRKLGGDDEWLINEAGAYRLAREVPL